VVAARARPGPFALAATIAGRIGHAPARARYARGSDGRVRVEAFELHVAEHCNLRCANCCNMSPLVRERTLSVDEVAAFTRRMASVLVADVVKIMGGEPLLHPDLPGVLRALRTSGIGDRVRLFTNGLLLAAQPDAFWEGLDELTISSYASAPVKPAVLELARARARRHDFVLNVKPVGEFTQVLSPRYQADDARTAETYQRCWLRHRCLVVRGRRFYMCTRAAYASEFLETVAHEPPTAPLDRSGDGISIDEPDLATALEAYMNRETPLGACRYCFGGDGATETHYQLTRDEVAAGVLSRKLAVVR
jgi:organic radical activating enzyme